MTMARPRKELTGNTYKTRFALRLKSLREEAGLTVEQLAEKSGIPIQTIYEWESGDRCPVNPQVLFLAEALKINVASIIEDPKK